MSRVEGVDYSTEGVAALREELIKMRDAAFNFWPEGIDATLVLSHTIAILSGYKETEGE